MYARKFALFVVLVTPLAGAVASTWLVIDDAKVKNLPASAAKPGKTGAANVLFGRA